MVWWAIICGNDQRRLDELVLVRVVLLPGVSSYDYLGSIALGPVGLAVVGPIAAVAGVRATLLGGAALVMLACALALTSPGVRTLTADGPAGA